ncbi:MAG: hypothetical protein JXM69_17535 [Anaerolineae bacterium]|nr:hypothetical protein [Anaerolineae bacterium]
MMDQVGATGPVAPTKRPFPASRTPRWITWPGRSAKPPVCQGETVRLPRPNDSFAQAK